MAVALGGPEHGCAWGGRCKGRSSLHPVPVLTAAAAIGPNCRQGRLGGRRPAAPAATLAPPCAFPAINPASQDCLHQLGRRDRCGRPCGGREGGSRRLRCGALASSGCLSTAVAGNSQCSPPSQDRAAVFGLRPAAWTLYYSCFALVRKHLCPCPSSAQRGQFSGGRSELHSCDLVYKAGRRGWLIEGYSRRRRRAGAMAGGGRRGEGWEPQAASTEGAGKELQKGTKAHIMLGRTH